MYRLSYHKEAEEILNTLSLEEKISLMSGDRSLEEVQASMHGNQKQHYNEEPYCAGGILEKGIPPIKFVDGTRGVVCGRGWSTCFPVAVMRGATFDIGLEEKVGRAIGEEVILAGGNLFAGICVNLPYHPGWGRAQEVYGEDSYLLGEMGAALVRGVQSVGVIACVKHFAFNSMEDSRFEVDIACSEWAEQEVFLPHFKKCIDAGAGAVMSAYNSFRGVPCGQNTYLLRDILKKNWAFDGFVMSDFNWGIKDTVDAANAGQDLEMPNTHYYGKNLLQAVKSGKVTEKVIDEAALRIVRTLLAHKSIMEKQETDAKKLEEHRRLALQCAREGVTLLRNQNKILPLKGKKASGKIVVLGELAERENTGDHGSSRVYGAYVVTPLQGIMNAAADAEIIYYAGKSISHCKRLAKEADTVILIVGNDYRDEGECVSADTDDFLKEHFGGDRQEGLGLKENDLNMIRAVASVRNDAVVILMGGGMITMTEWQEKTGAVLLVYYPGMEGGTAIGEILFGKVNPSGKLPFVIPRNEEALPKIQWNAKKQYYGDYHGYRLLMLKKAELLYPFGYGLSYTTFQIIGLNISRREDFLSANIQIKNTGKMQGAEVVFLYSEDLDRNTGEKYVSLRKFVRVELKREEVKEITLSCHVQGKQAAVLVCGQEKIII